MTHNQLVRKVILQSADQIEKHPEKYQFTVIMISTGSDCACPLGWIGYYAGYGDRSGNIFLDLIARDFLRIDDPGFNGMYSVGPEQVFYDRMRTLEVELTGVEPTDIKWHGSAPLCARLLRAYADKYHPLAV